MAGGASWELGSVARFFGTYEHSLDSKGRVILPARFRTAFEHGGYLTQFRDGCLALWTPEQFEIQMEEVQARAATGRADRNMARLWAAGTQDLEVDRQGRMVLPARMREYAGLENDVVVVGVIDRVELWDPARWAEKIGPEEQRLSEGADD
ncbi:MAG TPA: division/cell wall cluster transcriptional repressor MraZ [Acidimicrobiales bacterium]|nr:division/cell wall cluster transcriptional repressor MraZ [Acidimicrobiales bacterium]